MPTGQAAPLSVNRAISALDIASPKRTFLRPGVPMRRAVSTENKEAQISALLPRVGDKAGTLLFVILFIIESTWRHSPGSREEIPTQRSSSVAQSQRQAPVRVLNR